MIDGLLKLGPNQEVGNQPLHARSIENHKSAVDREPWLPCRSVHPLLTIQIETAALPLHNPNRTCYQGHPASRPPIITFPDADGRYPSSRDHVGHYRWPLPRSTPSRGLVGRYPDSVGRYPGTPSQWLRWGSVGHYPESVGRCPFLPRRLVIASTSPPDPGFSLLFVDVVVSRCLY